MIILLIIFMAIPSWREVQVLIDRGSWAPFAQFDPTAGVYIRFGGRSGSTRYKDL